MSRDPLEAGAPDLTLHASAVARNGRAVLILGDSGTGKSGLALRLIALGAVLVADDRVLIRRRGDGLHAAAPAAIRGLIEARGVGLLQVPAADGAEVMLAVDMNHAAEARMPQSRSVALLGVDVPLLFGRDLPNLDAILSVLLQDGHVWPG